MVPVPLTRKDRIMLVTVSIEVTPRDLAAFNNMQVREDGVLAESAVDPIVAKDLKDALQSRIWDWERIARGEPQN
jgi:hypothetical protein